MSGFVHKALIIAGPTASGKTSLALKIAEKMDCEILSADSRQVYRRMNIGTAKPSPEEMRSVPHHFIDIRNPDELFTAGEYGTLAREKALELLDQKKTPVIAGGSGLYIHAVIHGIFGGDYSDQHLRRQLEKLADEQGTAFLYEKLKRIDPECARRIHENDQKRIIRALEVIELSGKTMSGIQQNETEKSPFESVMIGLNWPRNVLYERINKRVEQMMTDGLLQEVKSLIDAGYSPSLNAMDSVGYKEIIAYLNGEMKLDEAVECIKMNTRRFAKRQMTWFRREKDMHWLDCGDGMTTEALAQNVLELFYENA